MTDAKKIDVSDRKEMMELPSAIKLGSLFDGIGAAPYAASFFGIKPEWASEIIPNAVSVTKRHFPDMEHFGDITKLDGDKIPPVDVICFGSPCQSFSVAGTRTGFDGKSGLFTEAIRTIREMRCAINGKQPQIVCFENVPGLLTSGHGSYAGRDYQTVLEAFCETEIPMPASGKWANAGMVRGNGIDLAWIIKDAQYHRTAQRRRRLFVIVDFTGQRAGEILFVPQSLSGYYAACGGEGQNAPAAPAIGVGIQSVGIGAFMAGQAKNARSVAYAGGVSPTLKGSPRGLNQVPRVCEPQKVYAICSKSSKSMKSSNPDSGIYEARSARTLDQNGGNPSCNQGGLAVVEPQIAGTLTARGKLPLCACGDQTSVAHPDVTGTLCASGAGTSRPAGNANETDLTVAYCLQGNMIGCKDGNGPRGDGVNKELAYTVSKTDRHAVVAALCRNHKEISDMSGTLAEKATPGYSLNFQNPVRTGCVVRRMTPIECERLMSFPDGYTEYGHDGKRISDSSHYQLLGNSIVVNVLAYIMQNIADALRKGGEPPCRTK